MQETTKPNATEQQQVPARMDVRHEVAQKIIEAMKQGETPWQKPWAASAMKPKNAVTDNAYRGINRVLLSLAGQQWGGDSRWVTFNQAAANGWKVRKGEKGQMIVKVVDLNEAEGKTQTDQVKEGDQSDANRRFALKRYFVFNAAQIDGMPPLPENLTKPEFDPVDRAENVIKALKEKTGLLVVHGGDKACYVPDKDEVRLPHKKSFLSQYSYYSSAMHECSHCTLSEKRMNRREALGKRWGDEAYSLEELRAEIASAIMASETGIPNAQDAEHIRNHASYTNSWIKAISNDPMAIFSAAKDAEKMASYMLGLEQEFTAMAGHKEWVAEYDGELAAGLQR